MFKKSLLAASIILTTAGASAAVLDNASSSGNTSVYGVEYIANEATGVVVPTVNVTLGAQYSVGDIVSITLSGADIDLTNSVPAGNFTAATTETLVLGLLSTSASTATFRVTAASGDHSAATNVVAFSGFKATAASLVDGGTTSFTYAAETSTGIDIDSASTNTYKILKGVEEYVAKHAASTDKFDATVSTGSLRTNFGTGVYADTTLVSFPGYTLLAGEADYASHVATAVTTSKVTVMGDFSFLDTNGDGKIDATDAITNPIVKTGAAASVAWATDLQSVVITGPAAFTDAGVIVTAANAAGDTTIIDQTFTSSTELTYPAKTGTGKKTTALTSGEWDLDGSSAKTNFMPFGAEYAQSITVTNSGSVEGAITVDLFFNGTKYTKTLTATSSAKSVTNISLEVAAFAAESGVDGNAQVTITTNAPSIKVEAVYYHKSSADRVLVPTSNT